MNTPLVNDIAAFIRAADDGYELSPYQLAYAVADFLLHRELITPMVADAVEDFAEQANRGAGHRQPKPLTAEQLAAAVVAQFDLDDERRVTQ
jgi:hypothetical protein